MAEPKGKQPDGEHIEELLSQLKGIFGHLSETEQREAREKISPPAHLKEAPSSEVPEASEPLPPAPAPDYLPDLPVSDMPPLSEPIPLAPEEPAAVSRADIVEPTPVPPEPAYAPSEIVVPPGATLVPAAIFYPAGRINDAKLLSEKVEKITPKFTKVAVVINVQALAAYDAKGDIKSNVMPQLNNTGIKAVLVLVDKALDDVRRKAMTAALETNGIYFQEVPFHQIEKKALYTDMLLGMVFFFDSQKKPPAEEGS